MAHPFGLQRQQRQPVNERFTLNADFHTGRAGLAPASTFAKRRRAQPSVAPSSLCRRHPRGFLPARRRQRFRRRRRTHAASKPNRRGPPGTPPPPSDPTKKTWRRADAVGRAQIARRHVYSQNASVGITTSAVARANHSPFGERGEYTACTAAATRRVRRRHTSGCVPNDGLCSTGPARFLVHTFHGRSAELRETTP